MHLALHGAEIIPGLARRGGGELAAQRGERLLRRGFVIAVTLHRIDEIRDQIVAALELNIDLAPALLDALAQFDEAVVDRDDPAHRPDEKIEQKFADKNADQ